MRLRVEVTSDISSVPAGAWDALSGDDDPFVEHAFLHALEASQSVGDEAGWMPLHVLAYDDKALVGALPLYAKSHSYGEYIFDWAWANAARGAGLSYYPKMVAMAPVTPATGRRFLVERAASIDSARARAIREALFAGAQDVGRHLRASSSHFNYVAADEVAWLAQEHGLIARVTMQFHWDNDGYQSFDDYLSRWRAKARKECKRERRKVAESGLDIAVKTGPEMSAAEWSVLSRFYDDTCRRKGSDTYLTPRFFEILRETFARRVVCAFAYRGGEPVAATLNFEKGKNLFGRYWGVQPSGTSREYESLHFELCYYRLIDRCIERGMQHFEAGAQGEHKLRRGLLPAAIHSAHHITDPRLRTAVAAHVDRENDAMRVYMAELAAHGPFRRDGEAD